MYGNNKFWNKSENESRKWLREVMTNNARELSMGEMCDICERNGIKLHTTVPYHPALNGVAERAIEVLTAAARAMLHDAGLPQKLWAEAFSTVTYLCNRTPTRALDGLTPFELLYGMISRCFLFLLVPSSVLQVRQTLRWSPFWP